MNPGSLNSFVKVGPWSQKSGGPGCFEQATGWGQAKPRPSQERRRKIDFHNSFRRFTRRTKQRWRVEPNLKQMRKQWNHWWNHWNWPMAFCLGLNCEWEMYSPPSRILFENWRISRSYRGEALDLESHLWIPSGYLA